MNNFRFVEVETVEMPGHLGCAVAGVIVGCGIGIAAIGVGAAIT